MKHTFYLTFLLVIISLLSCNKEDESTATLQSDMDKEIFDLINKHREDKGLNTLEFNEEIWKGAQGHSENMANGTTPFSHDGFSERVAEIRENMGLSGGASAENVAMGYTTATAVVNGWINSEGHKKNLEGDYTHSAVSAVKDSKGTYYYTQIFINE